MGLRSLYFIKKDAMIPLHSITFTDKTTEKSFELPVLSGLYDANLEQPIHFSPAACGVRFVLEYISPPTSKILVNPLLVIDGCTVTLEEVRLFECAKPGMLYKNAFYRSTLLLRRCRSNGPRLPLGYSRSPLSQVFS